MVISLNSLLFRKTPLSQLAYFQFPVISNKEKFVLALVLRTFARKTSTTQIFFIFLQQSDDELPSSEMQKNWGVTDFVFEIKRVGNYPNFDETVLVHVTRHGLPGC